MTLDIFLGTFGLIFISELGDKSQILAMTSSLIYRRCRWSLFLSGSLALILSSVAAIGVAQLVPATWVPVLQKLTGGALCLFALWLLLQLWVDETEAPNAEKLSVEATAWSVFWTQFVLVFAIECGDKTQYGIVGLGLKYQEYWPPLVLGASAAFLLTNAISIWGVQYISQPCIKGFRTISAVTLFLFGIALGRFT